MTGKGSIIISRSAVSGRGPRIPGVFPSSRFGEQVVSTGIPSLDSYIGGGITLGSICVLKDIYPSRYGDLVLKCFLAEGATYNHHLYIASDKVEPSKFISELPGLKRNPASNTDEPSGQSSDSSGLKIAWRYGTGSSPGVLKGQKEAKFEFKKKTTAGELGSSNLHVSKLMESTDLNPVDADELLKEIAQVCCAFEVYDLPEGSDLGNLQRKPVNNLVRIGISHCEQQVLSPKFMLGLRSIVRHTNSCAVVTVSEYNLCGSLQVLQCDQFADYIIRLEVILDDKRKAELGDVDGICEVVKMSSVNTLKPNELPKDLGFSFRNKRLTFQELHIPPEGETTTQRESSRSTPVSSSTCGVTIKGKSIDF